MTSHARAGLSRTRRDVTCPRRPRPGRTPLPSSGRARNDKSIWLCLGGQSLWTQAIKRRSLSVCPPFGEWGDAVVPPRLLREGTSLATNASEHRQRKAPSESSECWVSQGHHKMPRRLGEGGRGGGAGGARVSPPPSVACRCRPVPHPAAASPMGQAALASSSL